MERGETELPSWMTSVAEGRCDEGHVTGSRDEPGECASVLLEGVAGPQQLGLHYDLVVQSAKTTYDGRCVLETTTDEQDAFFVHVVPGIYTSVLSNIHHCRRFNPFSASCSKLLLFQKFSAILV